MPASPCKITLANRGVACSVIETSELLHFQSSVLTATRRWCLVSRSGESIEATELLKKVQRNCKVIGLINVPGSTVARQATRAILVNSLPDQLVAIQTYTGTVVTLLLLGAAFDQQLDSSPKTDLERTIEVLTRCVPEWYRFSGSWPGFFANNVPMYLLGRGPTLGVGSDRRPVATGSGEGTGGAYVCAAIPARSGGGGPRSIPGDYFRNATGDGRSGRHAGRQDSGHGREGPLDWSEA